MSLLFKAVSESIPIKIPGEFFIELEQIILKICMDP